MYYPALMMITCQACLCESEHRSRSQVNVLCGLFLPPLRIYARVCCAFHGLKSNSYGGARRSRSPPLPTTAEERQRTRDAAQFPGALG